MRLRLITEYSVRKILVKPRLGKRRCNGICPPSNPRIMCDPERGRCPLCPRAEVFPMPEPMPRPTRFLLLFACLGALRLERFFDILSSLNAGPALPARLAYVLVLFDDPHQMGHSLDHATDGNRVLTLDHLLEPGETQPLHHSLVLLRSANRGPVILQAQHRLGLIRSVCHQYSSCACLPRAAATSLRSLSCTKASKVALTTLCGFADPMLLVRMVFTTT